MNTPLKKKFFLLVGLALFACQSDTEKATSVPSQAATPTPLRTDSGQPAKKSNAPCTEFGMSSGIDLCLAWASLPQKEVKMGEDFLLELTLSNLGTQAAKNALIKVWSDNFTLRSQNDAILCNSTAKGIDCRVSQLAAGATVNIAIVGKSPAAGEQVITAHVTAEGDINPMNNEPRPFPKVAVAASQVVEGDATSLFLAARERCVKLHGEDKLALRTCMIEAKKSGKF